MQSFYQPTNANYALTVCQELLQVMGVPAIKNKQLSKQHPSSHETHKNVQIVK